MSRIRENFFKLYLCLIVFFIVFKQIHATEEYAEKTGKECSACHIDPSGGSELTAEGKAYKKSLEVGINEHPTISPSMAWLRLIVGYLHILTAVFWFGTILYVHLVLKPAYAAQGLPKGEVRVGLISMLIMLVTGIILTLFRISTLQMLFETRFGILLVIKMILFMLMMLAAIIAVFYIGPKLRRKIKGGESGLAKNMSEEELLYFDGKEGRPAYIAYKGNIYDVSGSGIWFGGVHFFKHPAGIDLTRFLSQAPHGEEKIYNRPKIGSLITSEKRKEQTKYQKIFFFLAYFNLGLVLLILLILALWRWWIPNF